jgi:hypothetical protein
LIQTTGCAVRAARVIINYPIKSISYVTQGWLP